MYRAILCVNFHFPRCRTSHFVNALLTCDQLNFNQTTARSWNRTIQWWDSYNVNLSPLSCRAKWYLARLQETCSYFLRYKLMRIRCSCLIVKNLRHWTMFEACLKNTQLWSCVLNIKYNIEHGTQRYFGRLLHENVAFYSARLLWNKFPQACKWIRMNYLYIRIRLCIDVTSGLSGRFKISVPFGFSLVL